MEKKPARDTPVTLEIKQMEELCLKLIGKTLWSMF